MRMDGQTTMIVVGVGSGITVCAVALLLVLLILIQKMRKKLLVPNSTDALPQWSKGPVNFSPSTQVRRWKTDSPPLFRRFKLREVKKATNDFSTIIGRGEFSIIYKARFRDGLVAAVKRMKKDSHQAESDFAREMELLGRLHHRHLVSLRGFCAESRERMLVYDYMDNGSLKEHLHVKTKSSLNWQTRMRIATGVAAALEYLHMYCEPSLCHFDIKSSNVLLDENFVAKVADFGLAHAAPTGNANKEITSDVRGTPGYMDPEYLVRNELTEKSDVYSFGVLLLEIITARHAVHERKNLVEWAQYYMSAESRFSQLVDPFLESNYDEEELHHLINLIKLCTLTDGKSRPTMRHVMSVMYQQLDLDRTSGELSISNSNVQSFVQTDMGSQRSIRSGTSYGGTTNRSYQYNETPSGPLSPSASDRTM